MKHTLLLLLLAVPMIINAQGSALSVRQSSTEALMHKAATQQSLQQIELPPAQPVDTLLTPEVPFTPMAVSMHGYSKRVGDAKESFFLRNETHNYRISRVVLKLAYSVEDGREIYRRDEVIECDLRPGATQLITIKSFDKRHVYYYYLTPPQRASGVPYRVQYDVLRYDVVVE